MTEISQLKIHLALDNKTLSNIPSAATTAEDVCIFVCKQLNIGTVARHLFALRIHGKQIFLKASATFGEKYMEFDFRLRFKPANLNRLKKTDIKAYDYYFHQVRTDVLENKVQDLQYVKYRKELLGLGITDMYRVILEKDIARSIVESDYKKYIPKEVQKKHAFFVKKPIHETLSRLEKSSYDAW